MGPQNLLVLEYHTQDIYSTYQTEQRMQDDGAPGTPTVVFNGVNKIFGAVSYSQYRDKINSLLLAPSHVSLAASMTYTDQMYIDVSATDLGASSVSNATLTAVIYQDIGTSQHHYVVRQMLSDKLTSPLEQSSTQQFHFTSQISRANAYLRVVVFLQAQSGQILQSVLATVQ